MTITLVAEATPKKPIKPKFRMVGVSKQIHHDTQGKEYSIRVLHFERIDHSRYPGAVLRKIRASAKNFISDIRR